MKGLMKKLTIIILLFAASASASLFINSFNSGQLGKDLKSRHDLDRTSMGSEELENILIRPQGMAFRRPGTEFIDSSPYVIYHEGGDIIYTGVYPTLQELTAAEIPDAPAEPSVTAATTAVSNATELQAMTGAGKYYLTTDIDLEGETWTPITTTASGFVLDGKDFTISNLTINSPASDKQGLFGEISAGCEFYDLTLSNFNITGDDSIASLSGAMSDTGTLIIKNVHAVNCIIAGDDIVGGLIGWMGGITGGGIHGCSVTNCVLTGDTYMAGLASAIELDRTVVADFNITDCNVTGGQINANDTSDVGGFAGAIWGYDTYKCNLHTCFSTMPIVVTAEHDDGTVELIGGFVGYSERTNHTSCYATGDITIAYGATLFGVGGYAGKISAGSDVSLINSYATGDISITPNDDTAVDWFIGGFVGELHNDPNLAVLRCYATGDITLTRTGGILWHVIGGFAGGLIANLSTQICTIKRCWATGDVIFDTEVYPDGTEKGGVGGFIGYVQHQSNTSATHATIENCYAWGSITTTTADDDSARGGFIGTIHHKYNNPTIVITNCYSAQTNTAAGSGLTDQITEGTYSGGLVGWWYEAAETGYGTITDANSYWDNETSEITASPSNFPTEVGTSKTTDWLQTKTNFEAVGWNFGTIWVLEMTVAESYWETVETQNPGLLNARRLIPFEYATNDAYVLEFGHQYIGFLRTTP